MGEWLLEQERVSRHAGSGLTVDDLLGTWKLEQVWPRRGPGPSALNGALLRGLGAQLSLHRGPGPDGPLELLNQVQVGELRLRFRGPARLEGRRPLLLFRFENVELSLGTWTLLRRSLESPQSFAEQSASQLPFFALIGGAPKGDLLGARGRGGGLAQWRRSDGAA
ncbi:MAG: hypothetical protein WCK64_05175 [Synechococcaceae cyanobacterium ELA445]